MLYLNNQNQLIAGETLFTGTINRTEVHPREVIKRALYHNAAAVVLAHNHPSGEVTPSKADRLITEPATDAAVISRFINALKARIDAYQKRKHREGKRVHPTTLHYVWAREFGECKGKKHYHLMLLVNRDTWCRAGDYPGASHEQYLLFL